MTEGVIIKGVGGQYTVDTKQGQYICNARGLFRKKNITPIVGDWVQINNTTLMAILPRKNELRRPRVANVDQVVVVMAAALPQLHFAMLDRYLMQAEHENIDAAICINKIDLDDNVPAKVKEIYEPAGYPFFAVSVSNNEGFAGLLEFLQNTTTVLAGPSGVGKSSIINSLTKKELETGTVSKKIGRGRHTTRHAEFIPINDGGYIIDTPGFSSLDPPDVPQNDKAALFKEFRPWLGQCKFRDCLHWSEQDCAIKEQIGKSIDPMRYERYLEILQS